MGDGETFEEVLLRADLLPRFIDRELMRGEDVTAARAMLVWADARIRAELRRGWEQMMSGAEEPAGDVAPLSIAELIGAANWPGASEATKALLESMGAPSGAFRVYVVPESASVTVDLGGGA